jgi:hypothetical protein
MTMVVRFALGIPTSRNALGLSLLRSGVESRACAKGANRGRSDVVCAAGYDTPVVIGVVRVRRRGCVFGVALPGTQAARRRSVQSSLLVSSVVALLLFFAPARVRAETPPSGAGEEARAGFEVMVRPTIGEAPDPPIRMAYSNLNAPGLVPNTAPQPGPAFGASVQIGYRVHPFLSFGLRGELQTTTDKRGLESAGVYARAYPLARSASLRHQVEPWVSVAAAWVHDGQSFHAGSTIDHSTSDTSTDTMWSFDRYAIGTPIGVGLDFHVTRALVVGPSFEYTLFWTLSGCLRATTRTGDCRPRTAPTRPSPTGRRQAITAAP